MEKIEIRKIIEWCNGKVNKSYKNFFIEGISTDSRKIKKGEIFIALKGEKFDGHDFVNDAFKKGAVAAIVSKDLKDQNGLLIKVKDTLICLGDIARNYRKFLNIKVFAITGSDGKTTTKEIIKNVLSKKFRVVANIGNYNNEIGVPLSLFNADKKTELAIIEMGMNKKGEIDYLSKICLPNFCLITNIGTAHIGFFKNRKEIAETKSEVFKNLKGEKISFLNRDDDFFNHLKNKTPGKILTIGIKKKADLNGKIIEEGIDYFVFETDRNEKYKMDFWNTSFIYSALFGVMVGEKFGIGQKEIKNVISEIKPISGRGEIIKGDIFIIDESYNSNPNSLKNSLLVFERKNFKRKIAILGDMNELGRFSNFYHFYIGNLIKKLKIDIVVTFGEKSKIISDVCEGKHFYEIDELKDYLKKIVKKEDGILIKGSRIMKMEKIVEFLKEWI